MKREHQESTAVGSGLPSLSMKNKMTEEEEEGVDELLAALGYKVRSSDMADVAQKLEQLDMVMGSSSSAAQDDAVLSHLAADAVHYNPSDLSSWLESMLSELNAPPPPLPLQPQPQPRLNPFDFSPSAASSIFDPAESSTITTSDLYEGREPGRDRKRMKTTTTTTTTTTTASPRPSSAEVSSLPLVVVDSQEAGIRLVHALMACAEAVQLENLKAADALIKQITVLAASQIGAMRKVAGYFAEALARRIYGIPPPNDPPAFADILHMNFYESAPYLKFAHFTANQAILEVFSGRRRVHVIDLGMKQGTQWPALLQALALRPGGPPSFRLTAVSADGSDALQQVGWKLAQLAETIHVDFDFRGIVADSVADLDLNLLLDRSGGEDDEAVAVNAVFELHRLLARPGAVERAMSAVRAARPAIVTVVEQEASHNGGRFAERFNEALHYYSTMFDSLEASAAALASPTAATTGDEGLMSEVYLGRQICNVVACEGEERTERHETVSQWRGRFGRAGFEPVHLGSNAFKQASMLLALFAGGDGYRVEEREGCLTLGWHTRPLIATSAWRVAD